MNNEEVIKRLEIIAGNLCGQAAQNPNLWPDYKAVDTAISAIRTQQALEQDLASTREALNAALEQLHRYAPCETCAHMDRSVPFRAVCKLGGCSVDKPDFWQWNGGEQDGKR